MLLALCIYLAGGVLWNVYVWAKGFGPANFRSFAYMFFLWPAAIAQIVDAALELPPEDEEDGDE